MKFTKTRAALAAIALSGTMMLASAPAGADQLITNTTAMTQISGTDINYGWAMTSDGTHIWVVSKGDGGSTSDGFVTSCTIVGTPVCTDLHDASFHAPKGAAYTGAYLFVANSGANTLTKIDVATKTVVGTVSDSALSGPYDVTWDGSNLFAANSDGSVVKMDQNGTVLAKSTDPLIVVTDEGWSQNASMSSDGTTLWALSTSSAGSCGGHCIIGINPSSLSVTVTYPATADLMLSTPTAIYSDGTSLWVSDDNNDTYVFQVNPKTGATKKYDMTTAGLGEDFYGMATNSTQVFIGAWSYSCSAFNNQSCIGSINKATSQAEGIWSAAINAALPPSGNVGSMYYWANGCLWWSSFDGGPSDSAMVRMCDTPSLTPGISSIGPNTGPTTGGTSITITGSNFMAGATVTVGSAACLDVVVVSDTEITCTTPPGALGTTTITVSNPGGETVTGPFTYVAALAATGSDLGGSFLGGSALLGAGLLLTVGLRRRRVTHQ